MDTQLPVFWETGMGGVDLSVDSETGSIKLNKYVIVADVGKAINPAQCEGQDEGAAIQGLGHTMFESLVYDNGQLLNPNLVDYRVPFITDLPAVFGNWKRGRPGNGCKNTSPAVNAGTCVACAERRQTGY